MSHPFDGELKMVNSNTPDGIAETTDTVTEDQAELLSTLFVDPDEDREEESSTVEQDNGEVNAENSNDENQEELDATAEEEDTEEQGEVAYAADDTPVQLADGTVTTVHELRRGFLRDADYTRKTQEVSALKRDADAGISRVSQLEQQITSEREQLAVVLQSTMPQEPDISLSREDPAAYIEAKAVYDHQMANFRQLVGNHEQATQRQQAELQQTQRQQAAAERESLYRVMPEMKDPSKLQKFHGKINSEFGPAYGFEEVELNAIADHRFGPVIRDALAYRALQSSTSNVREKIKGKPPVMRSSPRGNQKTRSSKALNDRIAQATSSGDARNVTDILGALLNN